MEAVVKLVFYYAAFGGVHELGHVLIGVLLGCRPTSNFFLSFLRRRVCIPTAAYGWREPIVRHAGWITSVLAFLAAWRLYLGTVALFCAALVVIEALASDIFHSCGKQDGWFFCGNFGMVLINSAWTQGSHAKDVLEKMTQVTMMRGAQSGGVVTFVESNGRTCFCRCCRRRGEGLRGIRARVLNGKRTDLSKSVRSKLGRSEFWARIANGPTSCVRLYAGHTRFATSSLSTLAGAHPHQWSPPCTIGMYTGFDVGVLMYEIRTYENFITHNGDCDAFDIGGHHYALETLQQWLPRATGYPMPCIVDSCVVAGFIDLLRTQGSWFHSVRYGFLFGVDHKSLEHAMPPPSSFDSVAKQCQEVFTSYLLKAGSSVEALVALRKEMLLDILAAPVARTAAVLGLTPVAFERCMQATIAAFFDNDLLQATRIFMSGAKGSFGLCVMCSIDSHRQMVLAARGQTMSIAFYPQSGLVLYGSEQAAVKAAVGIPLPVAGKKVVPCGFGPPVRIDLDDLGGELCLLDWGSAKTGRRISMSSANAKLDEHTLMGGAVTMMLCRQSRRMQKKLCDRFVPLEGNPLVLPLPFEVADHIARDIAEIPKALANILNDWETGSSLNRLSAWNLGRQLKSRLSKKAQGAISNDAIDILITGCEVSLWLGEQFASDLTLAFKRLKVRTISANKVLGLMGQKFKMPQVGHQFSEGEMDFTDAIVLIISHSGGTFSSLHVSNLLQSVSTSLFVVTSEWDTQIGKQLRQMPSKRQFDPHVFSTEIGVRSAEPCSISVAATHQLLTQIFLYISEIISGDENLRATAGCILKDVDMCQLSRCNWDNVFALEEIVGVDCNGLVLRNVSTVKELRKQGYLWAQHVLENPRSWILCAIYILVTVISGCPIITGICEAAGLEEDSPKLYITRSVDALIYLFLPQLFTLLIRLVQGRPLLHRMAARSIVIGDCPWVAQCAEAFLSKIFACAYSVAGVNVFSANPADHLVHRMTHRVVRGTLLAVGRPDGRLSALTSLENAVCLSVSQASSIQSIGSTCESLTIGHNPHPLPLCKHSIFLKGNRPDFLCERLLRETWMEDLTETAPSDQMKIMTCQTCPGEDPPSPGVVMTPPRASSPRSSVSTPPYPCEVGAVLSGSGSPVKSARQATASLENRLPILKGKSSATLLSEYSNLCEDSSMPLSILQRADQVKDERQRKQQLVEVLQGIEGSGSVIDFDTFAKAIFESGKSLPTEIVRKLFNMIDTDGTGCINVLQCQDILRMDSAEMASWFCKFGNGSLHANLIKPSSENYFGELLRATAPAGTHFTKLVESQELLMQLYESRIASLQRVVSFFVLFHEMGKRVADFWPFVSFGLLGYRMDRTHSIMRIATTASPVSGADVRSMMMQLSCDTEWKTMNSRLRFLQQHWRQRYSTRKFRSSMSLSSAQVDLDEDSLLAQKPTPRDRPLVEPCSIVTSIDCLSVEQIYG